MKNILKNKLLIGIVAGILTTFLLRPVLTIPLFFIGVFITIPALEYGITLLTFFLGGLVTGGIIKRKEALYAALVAVISTGIFLFFDWRAMSESPSPLYHIPRQVEIESLKQTLMYDVYITPFAILASVLGGILSKKVFGKSKMSNLGNTKKK